MDRSGLEGNIDLRMVQVTEMPWKELLRSLWLSSPSACFAHSVPLSALPKLILTWFHAETPSELGSNLLQICLGTSNTGLTPGIAP